MRDTRVFYARFNGESINLRFISTWSLYGLLLSGEWSTIMGLGLWMYGKVECTSEIIFGRFIRNFLCTYMLCKRVKSRRVVECASIRALPSFSRILVYTSIDNCFFNDTENCPLCGRTIKRLSAFFTCTWLVIYENVEQLKHHFYVLFRRKLKAVYDDVSKKFPLFTKFEEDLWRE